ncbi:MAG TPA: hypothetical protein VE221_08425, partial [Sphingomicrobium sp.]|nr:hypothetical protein [Sphingomicrobium sp.]
LYPGAWRKRYGDEMDELLRDGCGWRDAVDIVKAAAVERLLYSSRMGARTMRAYPGNIAVLVRKPSAMIPIVMSVAALAVVLIAIAISGTKRQPDEGAAAHVWQLLMAGQLPFLAWFGLHWLRREFKAALWVLMLQLLAFAAALFPVWYFGL